MITFTKQSGEAVWDIRGLSTDEKPINKVPNGSTYTEINTGTVYMFDEENKTWHKW